MTDKLEVKLVESAFRGNIDSFGELCQRYYFSMVAIAYSILADHHLAEDAAQETFVKALKKLQNLKQKDKFAPWLASICRNVAKDMVTTKSREVSTKGFSQLQDCYPYHEELKCMQ